MMRWMTGTAVLMCAMGCRPGEEVADGPMVIEHTYTERSMSGDEVVESVSISRHLAGPDQRYSPDDRGDEDLEPYRPLLSLNARWGVDLSQRQDAHVADDGSVELRIDWNQSGTSERVDRYDSVGRLLRSSVPAEDVIFAYDPQGRLIESSRRTDPPSDNGPQITTWGYEGDSTEWTEWAQSPPHSSFIHQRISERRTLNEDGEWIAHHVTRTGMTGSIYSDHLLFERFYERGFLVKQVQLVGWAPPVEAGSYETYLYDYDSLGRVERIRQLNEEGDNTIWVATRHYDGDSHASYDTEYDTDGDGTIDEMRRQTATLDDRGRVVGMVKEDANGLIFQEWDISVIGPLEDVDTAPHGIGAPTWSWD